MRCPKKVRHQILSCHALTSRLMDHVGVPKNGPTSPDISSSSTDWQHNTVYRLTEATCFGAAALIGDTTPCEVSLGNTTLCNATRLAQVGTDTTLLPPVTSQHAPVRVANPDQGLSMHWATDLA